MSKLKKPATKLTEAQVFKGFPNLVVLDDDPERAAKVAVAIRKHLTAGSLSSKNKHGLKSK
jgi:hypothetical protein